ncbi:class I histocompatibility antigen, F10 alpha chain-like [Rhinophrynus dorsalis]
MATIRDSVKKAVTEIFLCLLVSRVSPDSHFYRTFFTGVSVPGQGLPLFTAVVYIDDFQAGVYTSDTKEFQIKTKWIQEKVDPALWQVVIPVFQHCEAVSKQHLKSVMSRFNHTKGFHSYQWMYGCVLDDDGSTRGYDQHSYDGRDFVSLDRDRGIFVPTIQEAQLTAQRLNSLEFNVHEIMKTFLDNICVERLKNYIRFGKDELEKRVSPTVKVTGHQSGYDNMIIKLRCQVYGFYPRDVHVKWVKNGADDVYSEEAKQILPNPDGTYQIRVTVEVTPKEGDSYACHVDHSSLEEPLIVLWEPKKHDSTFYVSFGVIPVVIIFALLVGYFVNKKRSEYKSKNHDDHHYSDCNTYSNHPSNGETTTDINGVI